VVVAVIFNLIALGINSGFASSDRPSSADDIILAIVIAMTVLINFIAIMGLSVGRKTRSKLLTGLIAMYTDNQIDKYYDKSLVMNYARRYGLFSAVILVLGITAIAVPIVLRIF
jgi:hypothetical protein